MAEIDHAQNSIFNDKDGKRPDPTMTTTTRNRLEAVPERWKVPAVTGAVLCALLPLTSTCAGFWRYGFCMPASYLASVFMHVPCVPHDEGYRLVHEALSVQVTLACSAAGFFVLTTALVCGQLFGAARKRSLRPLLWIVPMCYGITLWANTTRIVLGWYAGIWARAHLQESFRGGIHTGVGVLVFLSFLVGMYALVRLNVQSAPGGNIPHSTSSSLDVERRMLDVGRCRRRRKQKGKEMGS